MTFKEYLQFVMIFVLLCIFMIFCYKRWKLGEYRYERKLWN